MKKALLEYIICPKCNGPLALQAGDKPTEGEIREGMLVCDSCKSTFPIQNGIPRFVPLNNYSNNFGFQWNIFKKTQLDSFSKTGLSRKRFFKQSGWNPGEMRDTLVLDAGCGAGRFAEIALETGAIVIAIDYSNAVDACWENLNHHNNLHVIQADIYNLPLKPNLFDYVYSFGVLQHTPDVKKSFSTLLKKTKPGGKICIDCYLKDWRIYLWVKYWLRPITKHMPAKLLFSIVQRIVPWFLPISDLFIKVPLIGHYLRYALPIANYKGVYPLNEKQLTEWAILDTFDMYSPKFDNPQTVKTINSWFRGVGLKDYKVLKQGVIVGRGVKMNSLP
jgi:SAM-dependent methyltransferase